MIDENISNEDFIELIQGINQDFEEARKEQIIERMGKIKEFVKDFDIQAIKKGSEEEKNTTLDALDYENLYLKAENEILRNQLQKLKR